MGIHTEPCGLHCIKMNHIGVVRGGKVILEDINIHIHCGKLNVIIGKNGAGKSTLVKAMLGEIPNTGEIVFTNQENGQVQSLHIGYVPQSINIDKNTPTSVYDLIAGFSSRVPVFLKKSRREYERIREQLSYFQVEHLIDEQVSNLSGGELQRVLLSLATIQEPDLLILDEPASGIDQNGMAKFYRTIYDYKNNHDLAIILISHDLEYVAEYADEVILLDTRILKDGPPAKVFESEEFRSVFGSVRYPLEQEGAK